MTCLIPLGDVIEIVMGQAPPGKECNKDGIGNIFVKAGEFTDNGPLIREWTTKPLRLAEKSDVLVCVVGATAGKVCTSINCAIGRSVAAIRPKQDRILSRFLFHFLSTAVLQLRGRSQGAAQGVITRDMLKNLTLVLPPLAEQKRIAAILDKADALRRKRREALALLDTLEQNLIYEAFEKEGDNFSIQQFGELAEKTRNSFCNGPFGSDLLTSELQQEGVPVIYIRDIATEKYIRKNDVYVSHSKAEQLSACAVSAGDLLLTKVGEPPCIAALYPKDAPKAIVTQDVIRIRLNGDLVHPRFLKALLNSELGRRVINPIIVQATRSRVSLRDLKKVKIPILNITTQMQLVEELNKIEELEKRYMKELFALDSLFASLQSRAFSGAL